MAQPPERKFLARHVNYAQREAENRRLGESGEQFVLDFERFHLMRAGRSDLASEVEWSSRKQGDGLGYDVRSFRIAAMAWQGTKKSLSRSRQPIAANTSLSTSARTKSRFHASSTTGTTSTACTTFAPGAPPLPNAWFSRKARAFEPGVVPGRVRIVVTSVSTDLKV